MEKNTLNVRYWIMKKGKPYRSFVTKADRVLYLKNHKIRISARSLYSVKDIVRFDFA